MDKEESAERYKKELDRGKDAADLLNNYLLKENLVIMKSLVISDLSSCDVTDIKKLQSLKLRLEVVNQFEGLLKRMIERGEVAENRLHALLKKIKGN